MRIIDPNEYVTPKRPPFGFRWLWRLIGGEVSR